LGCIKGDKKKPRPKPQMLRLEATGRTRKKSLAKKPSGGWLKLGK